MGGVRNGKSDAEPGAPGARQEALAVDALPPGIGGDVHGRLEGHLLVAARLLREHQAPKAFGELVRASRTLPMTRRLAAALVTVSLKAGTEAAAITILSSALDKVEGTGRRDVQRQLARVLRRVDQLPRAIEALEALLAAFPQDHGSRRVHQALLQRTGRWELLVLSLEREAQEAFQRGEYARAARATRWRARVQAEQMRNLARAAESYGQAANYLEQMEDAVGAFSMRLDGLRVLHTSGASEAVLTAAASVVMSAAARLGRDAQARQVLEELGLIPARVELAPPAEPEARAPEPEPQAAAPVTPREEAVSEASPPELPTPASAAPSPGTSATPRPDLRGPSPWDESEVTETAGPPHGSLLEAPAEAREPSAPAEEEEESAGFDAADGAPLTEVLEIPDEGPERAAPPVAPAEDEEPTPHAGLPGAPPRPQEAQDDAGAWQRKEVQLIARKAWPELAQLYLARAEQARDPELRAEALTRLAEVMENELNDLSGAARIYREIVTLTGDRTALKEQVRLLSQKGEPTLVRRALDEAVKDARTLNARAAAYLTRAERALEAGEHDQAKADFEAAEALTPGMLLVLAGLLRCVSDAERPTMANRLRAALAVIPRRSPDRLEALRVLAAVAEELLKDAKLTQWAWTEVLAEAPEEDGARARLLELARALGDRAALSQLLRDQLAREPRGPAARQARLELVSTLEAAGDEEGALAELRQAVRFEPGHKEAWLLLAERLAARGQIGESAWALEHAVTAMEDESERQKAWGRLAEFCRDVLHDPTRAEVYARRAEKLRQALEGQVAPPAPAPQRRASPRREQSGVSTQILSDDARPTIEFAAVQLPEAQPPPAPAAPPKAKRPKAKSPKAERPKAAPPKARGEEDAGAELLAAARALDELLGTEDEEDSDHTSPFLSAWSMRRPAAARPAPGGQRVAPRSQKALAHAPPPEDESTGKTRKVHPSRMGEASEEAASSSPPAPERARPSAPPPPASFGRDDTAPGLRAAVNPPPPRGARGAVASSASSEVSPAGRPPGPRHQEPADSPFAQVSPREPEGGTPVLGSAPVQNTAFISWEAPPGKMEPARRLARSRGGTGASKAPPPEPPGAEPLVFQRVRERPLESGLYAQIAHYFEGRGDTARAALMREIADALDGREGPSPRASRRPLSKEERSGLRHHLLRTPPGELLACVGVALCRLYPAHGRAAGTSEPLEPDLGPGAPSSLDALEFTERLLGTRAPEVVLAQDNGPPFSLVYTSAPRLLVGKQAVRQVLPAEELRFYAGRALACLSPDLLALRSLKKDQLLRGMALLSSVLKDPRASGPEARVVRETLSPRQLEQALALLDTATRQFDVSALADAARDSANRAGLIACGSVGAALAALRMKRALEREVVELVRFAASERYFQLRTSR
jgi:tetratricopeptide (TPR) repeat protein